MRPVTLVGIAGEDDLDAPDLIASAPMPDHGNPVTNSSVTAAPAAMANARRHVRDDPAIAARRKPPMLEADASARLGQQLLAELEQISDIPALTSWAHRILPLKINWRIMTPALLKLRSMPSSTTRSE